MTVVYLALVKVTLVYAYMSMLLCCVSLVMAAGTSLLTYCEYVSHVFEYVFQSILECHVQCLHCFCSTNPKGIIQLFLVTVWPVFVTHIMNDPLLWL